MHQAGPKRKRIQQLNFLARLAAPALLLAAAITAAEWLS
ncbi:hypothetical protein SAMCFNEI73_pC1011 (plasmid) [Sinorhizobium americanum]|uniref:Uncharacterized protein n=1 Tax=Sinorhizobium americanum TaxID=194963 RepID=A0A1L3LXG4_9HYPH|nr:hypothetical protein SAMCFNEI73_pC1011 [Sinorhizobium americanum]